MGGGVVGVGGGVLSVLSVGGAGTALGINGGRGNWIAYLNYFSVIVVDAIKDSGKYLLFIPTADV